ncbi:hypothetical protein COLO4_14131 [Corchorus olitorius]|uniref:Uncharacterized protein n=1 Tax=Corchorus olitorius TaxID=93759 RepID=A0A1R3JTR4_9ROSI|nr:hypothetical protein COLO4_14131 [Corchorus olitorius]
MDIYYITKRIKQGGAASSAVAAPAIASPL